VVGLLVTDQRRSDDGHEPRAGAPLKKRLTELWRERIVLIVLFLIAMIGMTLALRTFSDDPVYPVGEFQPHHE